MRHKHKCLPLKFCTKGTTGTLLLLDVTLVGESKKNRNIIQQIVKHSQAKFKVLINILQS